MKHKENVKTELRVVLSFVLSYLLILLNSDKMSAIAISLSVVSSFIMNFVFFSFLGNIVRLSVVAFLSFFVASNALLYRNEILMMYDQSRIMLSAIIASVSISLLWWNGSTESKRE